MASSTKLKDVLTLAEWELWEKHIPPFSLTQPDKDSCASGCLLPAERLKEHFNDCLIMIIRVIKKMEEAKLEIEAQEKEQSKDEE